MRCLIVARRKVRITAQPLSLAIRVSLSKGYLYRFACAFLDLCMSITILAVVMSVSHYMVFITLFHSFYPFSSFFTRLLVSLRLSPVTLFSGVPPSLPSQLNNLPSFLLSHIYISLSVSPEQNHFNSFPIPPCLPPPRSLSTGQTYEKARCCPPDWMPTVHVSAQHLHDPQAAASCPCHQNAAWSRRGVSFLCCWAKTRHAVAPVSSRVCAWQCPSRLHLMLPQPKPR